MTGHGVCPWWVGYCLTSPLRRLLHDPARILAPYIKADMTVLEPGPGMGSSRWNSRVAWDRMAELSPSTSSHA